NLFNKKAARRMALPYCDNRSTDKKESCRSLAIAALDAALKKLTAEQETPNVQEWTTPREDIEFQKFGFGSVPPIHWQNRGTHNHATEMLRDSGPIPTNPSSGSTPTDPPTESP
ncbi:MAG: hypothetical protein KY391_08460, partial [Actinobacteria bacterium]|nr:hypothetical protein [Actinomycetota bacterium]